MNEEPTEPNQVYIGARQVDQKGRVTIPSHTRDEHDIGYGDDVSLTVETIPDDPRAVRDVFETPTLTVRSRGQVTIPSGERTAHDIEGGDSVNVLVTVE